MGGEEIEWRIGGVEWIRGRVEMGWGGDGMGWSVFESGCRRVESKWVDLVEGGCGREGVVERGWSREEVDWRGVWV